ncbi:6-phosphofructokinase [Aestuariibacter sp. AA17]|uniref:6-phosphofructokinase n=1 Tax=Fluctibacter corallii TaxID=2984329 RepID=A0ABT3A996_9ALTE|nr:ATP-dependent 6-phosphofructokinase [Aestuariibacter sp. AA17]MCV2885252.1 6-phosphofructokinase [Aestuariibacter sp. AA17]
MKKIAILTSGGDAPGMNACIRAIVLTAARFDIEVIGYAHGYNGLLNQEYASLRPRDVHNIIQRGGTILRSARCDAFKSENAAQLAAQHLNTLGIEALLVIGGDGSFRGALHLSQFWQGQVIGIPGTIDNDIVGSDATIGYYTAIETALESIDKVRDTADAHERVFVVEVMGRHAGFIGLHAAVASSADYVVVPELIKDTKTELNAILSQLDEIKRRRGHCSYVIVISENLWAGGATELATILHKETQLECRPVILGHVQRGGSPVSQDRLLATKLGAYAVEEAIAGKNRIMVGEINQQPVSNELASAWTNTKSLDGYLVKVQTDFFNLSKQP